MDSIDQKEENIVADSGLPAHDHKDQLPEKGKQESSQKEKGQERVELWLTEAQKIILQHKLPHLFSLIQVTSPSSRLIAGSKMLQKESVQFVGRRRGRPEGSTQKNKRSFDVDERKSQRILKKIDRKRKRQENNQNENLQNQESDGQYSRSQEEQQNSFGRSISISKSGSRLDLRSEKSKGRIKGLSERQKQGSEELVMKCKSMSSAFKDQNKPVNDSKSISQTELKRETVVSRKGHKRASELISINLPIKTCSLEYLSSKNLVQEEVKMVKQSKQEESVSEGQERLNQSQNQGVNVKKQESLDKLSQNGSIQDKQEVRRQDTPEKKQKNKQQPDTEPKQQNSKGRQSQMNNSLTQFRPQLTILRQLKKRKGITPFLEPVDEERDGAPGYYSVIENPIDLQTIEFKLRNQIYRDHTSFHEDIKTMWQNARVYNAGNKFMQQNTDELQKRYFNLLQNYRPSVVYEQIKQVQH